jgi:hypothetical protein
MTVRKSVLLLLLAAIVVANAAYYLLKSDWSEPAETPHLPTTAAATAVAPPPMESLGHGARMPTAEELEEEARYDEARVAEANTWLNSPQPDKRASGAEQLSAFPIPSAEMSLINTLKLDFDPGVRRAAAQSLSAFKQPTDNSVAALLAALADDSEEVQLAAFNTLLVVAGKTENASPRFKNIISGMKSHTSSRHMKNSTRKAVRAFLKDQESPKFGTGN